MKHVLLAALIISNASCYLYKLSDVDQTCDKEDTIEKEGFRLYFSIPLLGDEKEQFDKYKIRDGSSGGEPIPLLFPEKAKVDGVKIAKATKPSICYDDQNLNLNGKIYFVLEAHKDMDLYHWFSDTEYSVPIGMEYTTIFSKNDEGSTLHNLHTDELTAFEVFSGLPEDVDSTVIYTHDPKLKIDSIHISEEHFHIRNTGSIPWNFTVKDGGENPKGKTFDGNGFIMTPGFPKKEPLDEFRDLKVNLNKRTEDKLIKIMVSSIEATVTTTQEKEIQLVDATQKLIVTVGDANCEFNVTKTLGSESCTQLLPKSSDSFNIKSENAAYTIKFDLEDIPSTTPNPTTKPIPVTVTTVKPTPAPEGTCAPSSCPATTPCPNTTRPVCPTVTVCPTAPVCPTVPVCSCSTSTTEVPSTTMGSSTKTVASLISLLTVYYAF